MAFGEVGTLSFSFSLALTIASLAKTFSAIFSTVPFSFERRAGKRSAMAARTLAVALAIAFVLNTSSKLSFALALSSSIEIVVIVIVPVIVAVVDLGVIDRVAWMAILRAMPLATALGALAACRLLALLFGFVFAKTFAASFVLALEGFMERVGTVPS